MLPGCILPPLTGLGWMGGLLAQGFRYRSTPAYNLAAPSGAPSQDESLKQIEQMKQIKKSF